MGQDQAAQHRPTNTNAFDRFSKAGSAHNTHTGHAFKTQPRLLQGLLKPFLLGDLCEPGSSVTKDLVGAASVQISQLVSKKSKTKSSHLRTKRPGPSASFVCLLFYRLSVICRSGRLYARIRQSHSCPLLYCNCPSLFFWHFFVLP